MIASPLPAPLPDLLARPPSGPLRVVWLGQAGFVIDAGGRRVVIDPYLSDSLADKYRGRRFPHDRLMPAPVAPGGIAYVDLVLATHAHGDHMDPGTLPALLAANPGASLVAPVAVAATALARSGIGAGRLIGVAAGDSISPLPGVTITATRAAHEDLARDAGGRHLFLGYGLALAGRVIFHSGDTIPYDGQTAEVARLRPDLALLPVNGRDAARMAAGIPGNLSATEAASLCEAAAIPAMIAHHFGMFGFNTLGAAAVADLPALSRRTAIHAASLGLGYHWP